MTKEVVEYVISKKPRQLVELRDHGQMIFGRMMEINSDGVVKVKVSKKCEAYRESLVVWATALRFSWGRISADEQVTLASFCLNI